MEKSRAERLEYIVGFSTWGLVPLHLYLGFLNLVHGIDKGYGHSYPLRSYVLIGVYLLIMLGADGYMLRYRSFALSKALRRYWGSALVAVGIVLLLYWTAPNGGGAVTIACLLYVPFVVLGPLLELLQITEAGVSLAVVGAFCLFNWAVCRFAGKEEKTA